MTEIENINSELISFSFRKEMIDKLKESNCPSKGFAV